MAHTDASLHEVALVRITKRISFPPSLTRNDFPAAKFNIDTGAGVIDADYRGILYILLFNLGDKDFSGSSFASATPQTTFTYSTSVNEGDRIAQLILERIYTPEISEVEVSLSPPVLDFLMTFHRIWRRPYVVAAASVQLADISDSDVAERCSNSSL
jgi:hypothetical protein